MNQLELGESPFDNMTRDELLREVQRMYAAITAANSCLRVSRVDNPDSPYWGKTGSGGIALEMMRQILEPIHDKYEWGSETIYRAFFRMAVDLLFDMSTGYHIGFGWLTCDTCGGTFARPRTDELKPGMLHKELPVGSNCPGTLRPLTWTDMRP